MSNTYFYAVVDKRNEKLILESGNLPIFWMKSIAENVRSKFSGTYVKRINVNDFYKFLNEGIVNEANRKLCPECNQPYITYTSDEYYQCNSCDHTWI